MKITSNIDKEIRFNELNTKEPVNIIAALNMGLEEGLVISKAATHVITGDLESSAKKDSHYTGATDTWEGEITFGGDGVKYAGYEASRDHDPARINEGPGPFHDPREPLTQEPYLKQMDEAFSTKLLNGSGSKR